MRMSSIPAPDANGCSVGSSRQESARIPKSSTTSLSMRSCCSTGKFPRRNESSMSFSRSSAINGTSSPLSGSKISRTSAAVVRLGVETARLELVEEAADFLVDEQLVGEARERLDVVRARLGAGGRHHRLLIPRQQARDPHQVGDLDQAL